MVLRVNRLLIYTNRCALISQSAMTSSNNQPITMDHRKTAGIIVIGDEILKGYTKDTNSHFLSKQLFAMGIPVKKISVISDDLSIISNEVRQFSGWFDHVITTGGVGPTHDDMTYEGVAMAFNDKCVLNEQIAKIVRAYFGQKHSLEEINKPNSPFMKLAMVPCNSELLYGTNPDSGRTSLYPVVRTHNITILPGVPQLMQRAFLFIQNEFSGAVTSESASAQSTTVTSQSAQSTTVTHRLYSAADEFLIADWLSQVAAANPHVNVGSYPSLTHSYYRVKVTVDSSDNSETDKVRDSLAGKMKEFAELLEESCSAIDETFHKYKLENCAISFNGGKDCTALLHLVHVCFVRKYGSCEGRLPQLQAIYIEQVDSFSEQDSFIHDTVQRYNLRLLSVDGRTRNMQKTLFALCEQHPQLQTVFLGGRRNDPGLSAARVHQATDEGWPPLMRVQPLLDWKYKHIWTLLRKLYLPYCSLYDLGYTSIGSKKNTVKNAALLKVDGFGLKQYSPAYCLVEEETERSGRSLNKK